MYKTASKPFRQLASNRCLRGFINMSGIDTIFECVSVCLCANFKPLGPLPRVWLAHIPISPARWTSRSISLTQTQRSVLSLKIRIKNCPQSFCYESERLVKASFVMHSLSCCSSHHCGVLAAYWITGTVNFHDETGGGERWKNSSDSDCFGAFHLKVL